jgi:hypothetical protein
MTLAEISSSTVFERCPVLWIADERADVAKSTRE